MKSMSQPPTTINICSFNVTNFYSNICRHLPNDYVYSNSEQANEESSGWTCMAANGLRYYGHLIFFLFVGGGRKGWALLQQRIYWTEEHGIYGDYVR